MSNNAEEQLLTALLTADLDEPQLADLLQDISHPQRYGATRKRKRQSASLNAQEKGWSDQQDPFQAKQHQNLQHETSSTSSRASDSDESADSSDADSAGDLPASAPDLGFRLDDPLIPELLSWISCAAILGGLAGSVAVASCCEAISQANGTSTVPALPLQCPDPNSNIASAGDEVVQYKQDTEAGQALEKVMDDLQASGANASQNLLPTLKRRNSGKRNLHKPWTAVEEDQLVRLVEQAEYRKQVVGISRLSKTGWAKIAHHLGRSGSSAVSGIKLKYRNLKERAGSSPATDLPAASSMPGPAALSPAPRSPFEAAAAVPDASALPPELLAASLVAASPPTGAAPVSTTNIRSSSKRGKMTACALAIMGLQLLPAREGTCKQIMTAIEHDPNLAKHLNWDTDQSGKVRWRNGVTCALSAEKSGIFHKAGKKQEGQLVWQLDDFKAKAELKRHAELA